MPSILMLGQNKMLNIESKYVKKKALKKILESSGKWANELNGSSQKKKQTDSKHLRGNASYSYLKFVLTSQNS